MRNFMVIVLLIFASFPASASGRAGGDAGIGSVISDFRSAILHKDREKFIGLFLHPHVTWQSVMSDDRLARERQENPAARKVVFDPARTPASFIDGIAGDPRIHEETFANVSIDSDGDAASVAFDFSYRHDGRVTNVGREYWLLVRTEAGWKIAAVTYSRNFPAES